MTFKPFIVKGGIAPQTNQTVDIGSSTSKFRDVYIERDVIVDGDVKTQAGATYATSASVETTAQDKAISFAIALG